MPKLLSAFTDAWTLYVLRYYYFSPYLPLIISRAVFFGATRFWMACGLYVLLALISFFFNNTLNKAISGSTGLIFTRFSLYGRYSIVDYRSDRFFLSLKGRWHGNQFKGQNWRNRPTLFHSCRAGYTPCCATFLVFKVFSLFFHSWYRACARY